MSYPPMSTPISSLLSPDSPEFPESQESPQLLTEPSKTPQKDSKEEKKSYLSMLLSNTSFFINFIILFCIMFLNYNGSHLIDKVFNNLPYQANGIFRVFIMTSLFFILKFLLNS